MVTSLYRLNDDNSEGDWYMVNKTFSSSPGSGYCTFSRANVTQALYPAENYFAESTTVFDHGPTSTVYSETTGLSVGAGLDGSTPTEEASYSVSWNSSGVDISDLTPAVAGDYTEWMESFTDTKSPSSTATYTSYNSTILTMPQGTPPFNVVTAEDNVSNVKCGDLGGKLVPSYGQTAILVAAPVLSVPPYPVQIAPGGTASFTLPAQAPNAGGQGLPWQISNVPLGINLSQSNGVNTTTITLTASPEAQVEQGPLQLPVQVVSTPINSNPETVLIAGGTSTFLSASGILRSAELYTPPSFAAAGNMTEGRSKAAATVLLDGDVLITGGAAGNGYPQATAELYNPAANTFTAVGNMTTSRFNHTASLLADGKVLIIGGEDGSEDQGGYGAGQRRDLRSRHPDVHR